VIAFVQNFLIFGYVTVSASTCFQDYMMGFSSERYNLADAFFTNKVLWGTKFLSVVGRGKSPFELQL